jgi:hypothetical protein
VCCSAICNQQPKPSTSNNCVNVLGLETKHSIFLLYHEISDARPYNYFLSTASELDCQRIGQIVLTHLQLLHQDNNIDCT